MKAHEILEAGVGHMKDRAATYDKPAGERSMGATVDAFRAITGHDLTEEQGWLFMAVLKLVRSQQGAYRGDSYEDGAAYIGLMGEAAYEERAPKLNPAVLANVEAFNAWGIGEARIDLIGQNGPTGCHYPEASHE